MQIIGNEIRARVYAGAAFLDGMLGTKWAKKIDAERLALENGDACILGQTFGDYIDGRDELGISTEQSELLGFYVSDDNDDDTIMSQYAELTTEWKKLLRNRKRQATRKSRSLRVPIV